MLELYDHLTKNTFNTFNRRALEAAADTTDPWILMTHGPPLNRLDTVRARHFNKPSPRSSLIFLPRI